MRFTAKRPTALAMLGKIGLGTIGLGMIAAGLPATLAAQQAPYAGDVMATVTGIIPEDLTGMAEGPEVEGIIVARTANRLMVQTADGSITPVLISPATEIRSSGGFLGLSKTSLVNEQLLNGLPVSARTVQWDSGLVASRLTLKNKDLRTAQMIRGGTEQRFGQQGAAIAQNAAATEALRGRLGDIDQYNLKGVTNVYFDTGKHQLSGAARSELCNTAAQAEAMDNALLLVVGYTDSTGSYEVNQALSEKRAGRVVNFLQQECGWKPYRMLTPTGMATADPAADNTTAYGRQQNRRVAVHILVSKSVDGM